MNWQEIVALVIVGITLTLLIRSQINSYRLRKTRLCGNDCGCGDIKFKVIK